MQAKTWESGVYSTCWRRRHCFFVNPSQCLGYTTVPIAAVGYKVKVQQHWEKNPVSWLKKKNNLLNVAYLWLWKHDWDWTVSVVYYSGVACMGNSLCNVLSGNTCTSVLLMDTHLVLSFQIYSKASVVQKSTLSELPSKQRLYHWRK